MMLDKVIIIAALLGVCFGASLIPCPESCRCQGMTFNQIGLECSSLEFLNKLQPKQIKGTVTLNISGIFLEIIDPKLKQLKNLETLDVSSNKISSLRHFPPLAKLKYLNLRRNRIKDMIQLPPSLESLDISSNDIYQITKEWTLLENLKYLNLNKNPIECTCETLLYYDKLVEMDVHFEDPIKCTSPKTFIGKRLDSLNCSMIADNLMNMLMKDQPAVDEYVVDNEDNNSEDNDYITDNSDKGSDKQNEDFEGSGNEGSGYSGIIEHDKEEEPIACHENCSTASPIGINDEVNASAPPSIPESVKILAEDIVGKSEESGEKSQLIEKPIVKHKVNIDEQIPIKEEDVDVNDTDKFDTETVHTKVEVAGEMERAVIGVPEKESNMTYYVLGGILVAFIALIVVVMMKKRIEKRRRPKTPVKENGNYEEMKPLQSNGKAAEKDQAIPKTPENTPLVGEENGKIVDNDPLRQETNNEVLQPANEVTVDFSQYPEVDPQSSAKSDTLKVTIKASELPDSIPKTPILVHRQLNNDGNYTTTFQSSP